MNENDNRSKVYFTREITPNSLSMIYKTLCDNSGYKCHGKIGVKLSTGEKGNPNYLKPELIGQLVKSLNATICECNTAYEGKRNTTEEHLEVAREHGFFNIADVDIQDRNGDIIIPVKGGKHLTENRLGKNFNNYDSYLILSHFKGHTMGGFGGALKNISIGFASSTGKKLIHTAGKSKSTWKGGEQIPFLESMAEAAKSVCDFIGRENILFINVMNNISVDCDCSSHPKKPTMDDIGILASTDPVALDQACVDMIYMAPDGEDVIHRIESRKGITILNHCEEMNFGNREYDLIDIDKNSIGLESKISTEDRKQLDDSEFGLPKQRKYPLHDKNHVMQAIRMFNYCPKADRNELASNIIKAAKKHLSEEEFKNIHIGNNNTFNYFWNKYNEKNSSEDNTGTEEKKALDKYDETKTEESVLESLATVNSMKTNIFGLLKMFSGCKYGTKVADKIIETDVWDKRFLDNYKTSDPTVFSNFMDSSRVGVCWDHAAAVALNLKKLGVEKYNTWFVAFENKKEPIYPSHSFNTFTFNNKKWFMIETCNEEISGIYSADTESDLLYFQLENLHYYYMQHGRGMQKRYPIYYTKYDALNKKLIGISANNFVNKLIRICKKTDRIMEYNVKYIYNKLQFILTDANVFSKNQESEETIATEGVLFDSIRSFTVINEDAISKDNSLIYVIENPHKSLESHDELVDVFVNYYKRNIMSFKEVRCFLPDLLLYESEVSTLDNNHLEILEMVRKDNKTFDKKLNEYFIFVNTDSRDFSKKMELCYILLDMILETIKKYSKKNNTLCIIVSDYLMCDMKTVKIMIDSRVPFIIYKPNIFDYIKRAINEFKNGKKNYLRSLSMFNDYSKPTSFFTQKIANKALKAKQLYHISTNPKIEKMDPIITQNTMWNENHATPRISFAHDIDNCIIAIPRKHFNDKGDTIFYVYSPIITNDTFGYIPTDIQVPDVKFTNEVWITTPVKVKIVGIIKAKADSDTYEYKLLKGNLVDELDDLTLPATEGITTALLAGTGAAIGIAHKIQLNKEIEKEMDYFGLEANKKGQYKRIVKCLQEFKGTIKPVREKVAQDIINLIVKLDCKKFEDEIPRIVGPTNPFLEYWNQWQYMQKHKAEKEMKESEAKEAYLPTKPTELWHGTNKKLQMLKPFESGHKEKYVYGAPDYNFALCYSGNQWDDLIINQCYYNGKLTLTEIEKGAFKKTFNTKGYVLKLDSKDFSPLIEDGKKSRKEWVSTHEIKPVEIIEIPNVYQAIKDNKEITLYHYPDLPHWIKDRSEYINNKKELRKTYENDKNGFYFYHFAPKNIDTKLGLLSPQYMYDHGMTELFRKSTDKYRDRIVGGWNIYPNKNPEDLTDKEIIKANNLFRKSDKGLSYIYFFKYPPYEELGPKMKMFIETHDIYRINIDDPKVKSCIKEIFWNNDMSHSDGKKLDEKYYRSINPTDYFKKYNDNSKLNFASLNHIGIRFKDDYCPISLLEKVSPTKVNESYGITEEDFEKYSDEEFGVNKSMENLISPFDSGSSNDIISNFQDAFKANFIGSFVKNLLSVTKDIEKLSIMKEALVIGVKVEKNDTDIIISGINFKRFLIRLEKEGYPKRIFSLVEFGYLQSDYQLYMRKKINKKNMRITKMKFNEFFALEIFNIFALLEDKYNDPAYKKICQILLTKTWLNNIRHTTPKPIDLSKLNDLKYTAEDYQKEFIKNYPTLKSILNLNGYILAFEQGLGKTFTSIALSHCLNKESIYIICPKKLTGNWKDEIGNYFKKYDDNRELLDEEVSIFDGTKPKVTQKTKYFITNYENIKQLLPYVKNNNHMIIIDESHNFRNVDGSKLKDLLKLTQKYNCTDILLCSGTPIKAVPSEITPALLLIDPLFNMDSAKAFSRAFNVKYEIATDILKTRFGFVMYRKDKSVLNLPEKIEKPLQLEIPNPNKYILTTVKKEVSARFKELYNEKVKHNEEKKEIFINYVMKYTSAPITATNLYMSKIVEPANSELIIDMHESEKEQVSSYIERFVLPNITSSDELKKFKRAHSDYIRMRQSAIGSAIGEILVPRRSEMYIELFDQNKDTIINMITNNPKKTVIFSQFKPVVNHICDELNKEGVQTVKITGDISNGYETIKMFKEDDNVEVIIATSQSMGTGQTLTQADQMFFFGPPWRSSDYDQCCDRIHRIGQTTPCHIYNVLLKTEYPNLSTRMDSILVWSQNMFDTYITGTLDDQANELQKVIQESFINNSIDYVSMETLITDYPFLELQIDNKIDLLESTFDNKLNSLM